VVKTLDVNVANPDCWSVEIAPIFAGVTPSAVRAAAADVAPVPPELTPSVPASVTAPVEFVAGVRPESEVLKDVTPAFAAAN